MTEKEKVLYAKAFIDKMANGINPITESSVLEEDTLNNVRISRCLFYVSDILRQVADNGGTVVAVPEKRTRKKPFEITEEQISKIELSSTSINISEICRRINAVTEENMKPIQSRRITDWLISKGIMQVKILNDGHKKKIPTKIGESMGLTVEQRNGQYGIYETVVYNREAQEFVVDNLLTCLKETEK